MLFIGGVCKGKVELCLVIAGDKTSPKTFQHHFALQKLSKILPVSHTPSVLSSISAGNTSSNQPVLPPAHASRHMALNPSSQHKCDTRKLSPSLIAWKSFYCMNVSYKINSPVMYEKSGGGTELFTRITMLDTFPY